MRYATGGYVPLCVGKPDPQQDRSVSRETLQAARRALRLCSETAITPVVAANAASKKIVVVLRDATLAQAALATAPISRVPARGRAQQAAHAPMSAREVQRLFVDEEVGRRILEGEFG